MRFLRLYSKLILIVPMVLAGPVWAQTAGGAGEEAGKPSNPALLAGTDEAGKAKLATSQDELDYLTDRNEFVARGNVKVSYGEVRVEADEVRVHSVSLDFTATGNVMVTRGAWEWRGDMVTGNLKERRFIADEHTITQGLWTIRGAHGERAADGVITIQKARATACDDWWIHAKTMVYHPNGDFVGRHVVYKTFGVPLLYLPRISGNINELERPFHIRQGHKNDWGYFVGISKNLRLSEQVETELLAEYRAKRGLALGNRTKVQTERTYTDLFLYGMQDQEPLSDLTRAGQEYNGRFEIEEDRFRIKGYHRTDLLPELALRLNAHVSSDNDMLFEYFDDDYRVDPEPKSYADLTYSHSLWSLSTTYRPRLNDFETAVERLPEVRLALPRQPVFGSAWQYEGETALAQLRMNWREYDLERTGLADPEDYAALRLDSAHVLYRPMKVFSWLNLTPRAGIRVTSYDRSSAVAVTDALLNDNFAVDEPRARRTSRRVAANYDSEGGSTTRLAYEFGAELGFKTYRTWPGASSARLSIDGLRHVAEPYLNYTYIPTPDEEKDNLYFFDEIDRLDRVNLFRLGARQRLETRIENRIHTFARLENYVDFHVRPRDDEPELGDFGSLVELSPGKSFTLWAKMLVGADNLDLNVFDAGARVGAPDGLNMTVSYLFRDSYTTRYAYSMGSHLTHILSANTITQTFDRNHNINLGFKIPLNEKTDLRVGYYYDLAKGKLGRQSYELTRDLGCWIGSLKVVDESANMALYFLLYLKQLPEFKLGGSI